MYLRSEVPVPILTTPCVNSCELELFHILCSWLYCMFNTSFGLHLGVLGCPLPKETPSLAWPKAAEVLLAYVMTNTEVGKGRCQYHD